MEFNNDTAVRGRKAKLVSGILVLSFGVLFLLDRIGIDMPNWLFSWKIILIAIGVISLYKNHFKHLPGYIMIGVGTVFLINDFWENAIDGKLIFPCIIILVGISILSKSLNIFGKKQDPFNSSHFGTTTELDPDDYIDSTALFGGINKTIVSKNFRGAKITSVFGGVDLNLTKSDLQEPAIIHTNTVFGGTTLIVPSDWTIKSEIMAVFGGIDDNRKTMHHGEPDPKKTLILKGNCFFGGVEIQSYI